MADSSLVYITSLPRACDWVEARRLHANVLLVGRSAQGQLFANSRQLCANCTSFTIHSDFLVYTTQQHYAHFIPLRDATCAQSEMWTSSKAMMRRVERGSRIVVAPPGDVSLVLVHPRGNLETVHPRPLVVARITALLDSGEYGAALIACRKHRVDMNLLYDHCPSTWERDVEIFIRKVDSDDYLNLFLTGLSEEDITKTLPGYVAASTRVASLMLPPDTSKVNRICDLMHTALNNIDDPRYFHALLMTYVRKQPQDLEGLLSTIVVLRRGNESDAATGRIDAALRFVVVYVDVDALYRVALGMYDFALAILVAQHSHQVG